SRCRSCGERMLRTGSERPSVRFCWTCQHHRLIVPTHGLLAVVFHSEKVEPAVGLMATPVRWQARGFGGPSLEAPGYYEIPAARDWSDCLRPHVPRGRWAIPAARVDQALCPPGVHLARWIQRDSGIEAAALYHQTRSRT